MSTFKKGEPTHLVRLAYPTFSSDDKIEKLIGVGQFIPLAKTETDRYFEFTLDEESSEQPSSASAWPFGRPSPDVQELT